MASQFQNEHTHYISLPIMIRLIKADMSMSSPHCSHPVTTEEVSKSRSSRFWRQHGLPKLCYRYNHSTRRRNP